MSTNTNLTDSNVSVTDNVGGFLSFLIASLVSMANDPTNKDFFLPDFLSKLTIDGGKTLVPYVTDLNLGPQPSLKTEVSGSVCNSGWAVINNYSGGAAATTNPILNITSTTINGINNAKVSSYETYAANASMQYPMIFSAEMNAYTDFDKLTFNPATFFFDVTCQTNQAQSSGKKASEDIQATGTFQASVGTATFTIVILLTLNSDLTASISIPSSFTDSSNKSIPGISMLFGEGAEGLSVTNITLDGDSPYNVYSEMFIQEAFSDPSTITTIQDTFNAQINTDGIRNPVAAAIEQQFNSLINDLK